MREEQDRLGRLHGAVEQHEHQEALSSLAYDVLSRQATGRTLFAGREYVNGVAERHGVDHDKAQGEYGNLLAILERGPESDTERAVVVAFAMRGFSRALSDAEEGEISRMLARFVTHADWLEMATPYEVYAYADGYLSEAQAAGLWEAVGEAVLKSCEDMRAEETRGDIAALGLCAMRLGALRSASADASRAVLARVAQECRDPDIRTLARKFAGGSVAPAPELRIEGVYTARVRGRVWDAMRALSGLALLAWLFRALGSLVGHRVEAVLELEDGSLKLSTWTRLLGRTVAEREEVRVLSGIASITRASRYRRLHLFVGLVSLSIGLIAGGILIVDGVRTGETVLLLLAGGLLLFGAGLDLALDILVPAAHGRVRLEVEAKSGKSFGLSHVQAEAADAFLDALAKRL